MLSIEFKSRRNTINFTGDYIMWNDSSACSKNNAQCVRIYKDCICHCLLGFILVDEKCLKSKKAITCSIKQVRFNVF